MNSHCLIALLLNYSIVWAIMYAQKFIVLAALCLTTVTTTYTYVKIWHMERLLQKPFWTSLISTFPDAQIRDTDQQTVSIAELFAPCPSNRIPNSIVNGNNLNDKMRQYYNLLTIVFNDALAWNLRYLCALQSFHDKYNLKWGIENHITVLIGHYYYIYSIMQGALMFVSVKYPHDDDDAPPLDDQLYRDLLKLLSVRGHPIDDMFGTLKEMSARLEQFLKNNSDVVSWRNSMEDKNAMKKHVVLVATSKITEEDRIMKSKLFLTRVNQRFLEDFEGIGFVYDEKKDVTSRI